MARKHGVAFTLMAVIDIGSNTVHPDIAVAIKGPMGYRLARLPSPRSSPLALGERGENGQIDSKKLKSLARTLDDYVEHARREGVDRRHIHVVATAAVREATNRDECVRSLKKRIGLPIRVLDQERELDLSLRGAGEVLKSKEPTFFVESGGGSTQVALVEGREPFPLGLLKDVGGTSFGPLNDPPTQEDEDRIRQRVRSKLGELKAPGSRVIKGVVTGGSAHWLPTLVGHHKGTPLTVSLLRAAQDTLRNTPVRTLAEQVEEPRGEPDPQRRERRLAKLEKRIRTLLPGAVILQEIFDHYSSVESWRYVDGPLRAGVLLAAAKSPGEWWK